ncbi:MAG: GNAT family N-acetyltransferase [Planctomycetota bacterium]
MPDMLVKLYDLPADDPSLARVADAGIVLRLAMPYERTQLRAWIEQHFSAGWADEFEATLSNTPVSTVLAVRDGELLGFACYDATARGFFGPTGVAEASRGLGVGRALLVDCLRRMRDVGYGYAAIGGVGPAAFYEKAVGATLIEGSDPGVYRNRLAKPTDGPAA